MIDQIRPKGLAAWFAAVAQRHPERHLQPLVLDVREPWELQTASIQPDGFEVVAIPMHEIAARFGELDAQRPIACLCHHGARSQRVAAYLGQNGFHCVANIAGGIDAWSAEQDATVTRY